ncbi:hypothetical protein [Cetobacterium sp.]|uniref:hypothetical protein n=1 Tax=Cetobacterium sp. TaxID=2071632 RepID=UPI003EE433A3
MINFSFFICIFLTSFSKNELTTIEALPQREKVNLDIEVLKIKTEKITGVIYENENKIIFDFKDLKKAAEKKKITTDSNNYELFILENLDNAATYMKKNEKFKMNRIFEQGAKLRNGEKIKLKNISYSLIEQNREKVLEVSYDLKPETFYLGVINNKTGLVEKIYKAEFIENIKSDNYHIYNNRLIKEIIIDDRTSTETDLVVLLGTITYSFTNHSGSLKALSAIGIGTEKEWEYSVKDWTHVTTKPVDIINIPLVISGSIHPYFSNPNSESNNLLVKKTFTNSTNKYITLAAFGQIAAQLKICIPKEVVQNIKDYASRPEHNDKDFVEILYNGTHSISLIPSSEGPGQSEKNISIPNKFFGNVITIPYPQIKFKKKITPTFEIEASELDFGTVLKGDNSKTATSKIVIQKSSDIDLNLVFPNGKDNDIVILNNNITSQITADISVGAEQKETSTGKSYFMLNGKLTNTSSATTEGEHKGQFYLNIELK